MQKSEHTAMMQGDDHPAVDRRIRSLIQGFAP
jgi:hypothetical protein